jgi:hypothetical protein
MIAHPPHDPAEHAKHFAIRWRDKLEQYCTVRWEELGIHRGLIGGDLLNTRVWDLDEIVRWSHWRMARNRDAAAGHRKRRAAGRRRLMRSRARAPAL